MKLSSSGGNSNQEHLVVSSSYTFVLGEKVKIDMVSDLHVEGEKCEGVFYLSDRRICLENSFLDNPAKLTRVRKHEVMHAFLGISGLSDIIGDIKLEEAICVLSEVI